MQLLLVIHLNKNPHRLLQDIHTGHLSGQSIRSLYFVSEPWQVLVQCLVRFLFVFQAAHQSSAGTRNLRRIQRQILLLRHFDRHRDKIRQIGVAAKRPSADSVASENFRLIPHANLTQLNSCTENTCKILYQIAEIHSAV